MKKNCIICNADFNVKPSHYNKRITCSKKCMGLLPRDGNKNPNWKNGISKVKAICKNCSKKFTGASYRPNIYCSRLCQNRFQSNEKKLRCLKFGYKVRIKTGRIKPHKIYYCSKCKIAEVSRKAKFCKECRKKVGIEIECKYCHSKFIRYKGERKVFCNVKCRYKYLVGTGNPHYIDGRTPLNKRFRASEEYKNWRVAVFQRDKYTCKWCGQVGGVLHADHIKQFAFYPELRTDINNGRTLCLKCHKKTDSYLKGYKNPVLMQK